MNGTGTRAPQPPPSSTPPDGIASRRIVVTGAAGFIGHHLVDALGRDGHRVVAVTRQPDVRRWPVGVDAVAHPGFGPAADWAPILAGADAVVHAAGLAHGPIAPGSWRNRLRTVNVQGTDALARAAARAGVADFVFLSSIKAVAERSGDAALDEAAPRRPEDCYGLAKALGERRLERIAATVPAMRVVCLRPPLVYGSGVGANFAALMRGVDRGLPLPFARIDNRRSLVYVGNLVDAIRRCLARRDVAGGPYHVCDDESLSTPGLIRAIAAALGRPARLLPVPVGWLDRAARLAGRQGQWQRLSGSLAVSNRRFSEAFGWTPPYSVERGLEEMVRVGGGRP